MNRQNNILKAGLLAVIATSAMVYTSCQDEDFGFNSRDIAYNSSLVKVLGTPSPDQTWTTAVQNTVNFNINMPGEYALKVYSRSPRGENSGALLLADFQGPFVGETGEAYPIRFDAPQGLESVYVSIESEELGGRILKEVKLDADGIGDAFFGAGATTRGINLAGTTAVSAPAVYSLDGDVVDFPKDAFENFMSVIPEEKVNTNKSNLSYNFVYVSSGVPVHLYPIYTYTNANDSFYIQYRANKDSEWSDYMPIWLTTQQERVNVVRTDGTPDQGKSGGTIGSNVGWTYTDYTSSTFDHVAAQGITIDIPAGYQYRLVIRQHRNLYNNQSCFKDHRGNDGSYYNGADNNYKALLDSIMQATNNIHAVPTATNGQPANGFQRASNNDDYTDKVPYFCTFNNGYKIDGKSVTFIGAEDWFASVQNADLNDIVFAFVGETPEVVDNGTVSYTSASYAIAYEDMGTNDFDFNDVVLMVEHTAGQQNANVYLKAVGGTLPVYLHWNGESGSAAPAQYLFLNEDGSPKELHKALTQNANAPTDLPVNVKATYTYGKYENVQEGTVEGTKASGKVVVTPGYTPVVTTVPVGPTFTIVDGAKDFSILVFDKGDIDASVNYYENATTGNTDNWHMIAVADPKQPIYEQQHGRYSQGVVIADVNWQWPIENELITNPYPAFAEWVGNPIGHTNWYDPTWSGSDNSNGNITNEETIVTPGVNYNRMIVDNNTISNDNPFYISAALLERKGVSPLDQLQMAMEVINRAEGENITVTVKAATLNADGTYTATTVLATDVVDGTETAKINGNPAATVAISNWSNYEHFEISYTSDKAGSQPLIVDVHAYCRNEEREEQRETVDVVALTWATIDAMETNDTKIVLMANPHKNNGYVLGYNGDDKVGYGNGFATVADIDAAVKSVTTTDNYLFTLTCTNGTTNTYTLESLKGNKSPNKNGNGVTWGDATDATNFTLTGNITPSSTGDMTSGWSAANLIRFTQDSYYLNAGGGIGSLQYKDGTGEWSIWYLYEMPQTTEPAAVSSRRDTGNGTADARRR